MEIASSVRIRLAIIDGEEIKKSQRWKWKKPEKKENKMPGRGMAEKIFVEVKS